jgi:hypothetical protein
VNYRRVADWPTAESGRHVAPAAAVRLSQ